jgi:hypothetical protein
MNLRIIFMNIHVNENVAIVIMLKSFTFEYEDSDYYNQ